MRLRLAALLLLASLFARNQIADAVTYTFSGHNCLRADNSTYPWQYNSIGLSYFNTSINSESTAVCPISGIESSTVDITSASVRVYDGTNTNSVGCSIELRTQNGAYYNSSIRYSCGSDATNGCSTSSPSGTGYLGIAWTDPLNGGAAVVGAMPYQFACTIPGPNQGLESHASTVVGYQITQTNP